MQEVLGYFENLGLDFSSELEKLKRKYLDTEIDKGLIENDDTIKSEEESLSSIECDDDISVDAISDNDISDDDMD